MIALAGWVLAGLAGARCAGLARRLDAVGDAEHELRGALTAFGLGLDRLGRDPLGRRLGRDLASELDRARSALADLAAARAGEGRPSRVEPLALERLARSAAAAWQPAARAAGRRVVLDWRAGPIHVRADRGRLAQALGNLRANAVEHGAGPIRVEARRTRAGVRLEVVNGLRGAAGGVGQPRAAASRRGRGLRIASRAVEESGGRLSFMRSEGRAAAAIDLPLAS